MLAPEFAWTDLAVAQLRRAWAEGVSASLIAAQFGCSRSAVLGKVHRLKLPKRAPTRVVANIPSRRGEARRAHALEASRNISLLELACDDCRYPLSGQGRETLFCGAARARGAYCARHAQLCYAGFRKKEAARA